MGMGDEIMAAGQAERLFQQDGIRVAICDKRRQVRWSELWEGNPAIASPSYVAMGGSHVRITNGVGCRPYIKYPFTSERGMRFTHWRSRDHVGTLYLTDAELKIGRIIRDAVGPFLLLEPDVKPLSTPNKRWGLEKFSAVVKALPEVTFIRAHGHECRPFPGVRNIHTLTFRDACGILAASDGYVGTEGGFHHAAAALGKPGVVIFGGFISPKTTGYPSHINLTDTGIGSPCGRWKQCEHCTRAMEGISVEDVVGAVRALATKREEAAC